MIAIRPAVVPDEIEIVRTLFREYVAWLGEDLAFQGFEAELASLPGKYSPPAGGILLAADDGDVVGCCAFRPSEGPTCELKRLWVRPRGRRLGTGSSLVLAVEAAAAGAGYTAVVLDTLERMTAATRLYESLGYERVPAYYHNPIPGALFFRKRLAQADGSLAGVDGS